MIEASPQNETADYLNVNVPVSRQAPRGDHTFCVESMTLTLPDDCYDTTVRQDGDRIQFRNDDGPQSQWIEKGRSANEIASPPSGSTQAAIRDGDTAVTPLQIPYQPIDCPVIRRVVSPLEGVTTSRIHTVMNPGSASGSDVNATFVGAIWCVHSLNSSASF